MAFKICSMILRKRMACGKTIFMATLLACVIYKPHPSPALPQEGEEEGEADISISQFHESSRPVPLVGSEPEGQIEKYTFDHGAIIRGDAGEKKIALVFTGHEFADGGEIIRQVLKTKNAKSSFFFTGDFYRNPANAKLISGLAEDGHYLGPHSDKHLLYCSWEDREKLLVTKDEFLKDVLDNYKAMETFGIRKNKAPYFIPPYEWSNEAIVAWAKELELAVINFTPGTLSNADYTTPEMPNYRSSGQIYKSIIDYETSSPNGLNGFILLIHIGTHPDRNDKFYRELERLMEELEVKGYAFVRVDNLLVDENPTIQRGTLMGASPGFTGGTERSRPFCLQAMNKRAKSWGS